MITLNKDRKQTKYGHKRQEHMTHTTEPWQLNPLRIPPKTLKQKVEGLKSILKYNCLLFLEEVPDAHQVCIYLIKKYSKNSNLVKYFCNLKLMFSSLI